MSHDPPPPARPPLAPPFSRPTHPGYLPTIALGSPAARPLRPTPYASAVIPPLPPPPAARSLPTPSSASLAAEEEGEGTDHPATSRTLETASPVAASTPAQSLRDVPGDHGHSTGVPANPETAVEGVDAVSDYPMEAAWSSEAVFGWGASEADWEVGVGGPGRSSGPGSGHESADPAVAGPTEDAAASFAAGVLESLAGAIRRGELSLAADPQPRTPPAVLAALLSALLARPTDDQWEAREASVAEQER